MHTLRMLGRIAAVSLALATVATAQDWPQWRGPNRDGAVASFREPASWPQALTARWKVEVGTGYATPLVVGDRIYAFARLGNDEVMTALDAGSGKVVWRTGYPAPFAMNPATARHGPGPKSTPAFASGRLFTLGMTMTGVPYSALIPEMETEYEARTRLTRFARMSRMRA